MNRAALGARVLLPLVLSSLALAACTGSLFKSKIVPPATYFLSAEAPPPAAPRAAPRTGAVTIDMAVLKPRVRTGLESDRIAALYQDRRLEYFAGARWSGPLDQVVQDLAVQVFHAQPALRNVSADASEFASAYWLEIEVSDFQAEYAAAAAPTVHVRLQARVGGAADRRILGRFEANAHRAASDNRLNAIVDAYARAANAALDEIAADVAETLGKTSEAP